MDGQPLPCSLALNFVNSGAAAPCPEGGCGPRWNWDTRSFEFVSITEQGIYVESTGWRVAYGWVNASTGASWQKLRGERQRRKVGGRGSQRPRQGGPAGI